MNRIGKIILLMTHVFMHSMYAMNQNTAQQCITQKVLAQHTSILASDEYEGRFPGTRGEEKTCKYLIDVFNDIGLKPGNPHDGTFFQEVPFVEVTPKTTTPLSVTCDGHDYEFAVEDQVSYELAVASQEACIKNADLVYVGYGIVAPEYKWNDYAHIDVRGKVVIVLVNDPGFITNDSSLFNGKAMTYYGRWPYKYEEAIRHGAAGCFIIHQTDAAGYPWRVIGGKGSCSSSYIRTTAAGQQLVQGWIHEDAAKKLLGKSYVELAREAAQNSGSCYQELGICSVECSNSRREFTSHNLVAFLPGKSDEMIIYSAHWDHLGHKESGIYHGARDNALSVSALIALADAFQHCQPEHNILFFMATAEEQGLIGSEYYVQNPLYPLNKIKAVINMDLLNIFGKTTDISFYGGVDKRIKGAVDRALLQQNRILSPDPVPENGMYYRSDHWPFAKRGVPALFINMGFIPADTSKPGDWILEKNKAWVATQYHTPADTFCDDPSRDSCWDLNGAIQDVSLLFMIGLYL